MSDVRCQMSELFDVVVVLRIVTDISHLTSDLCLEFSQNFKQVFVVWLIRNVVNVFVSELAFFIDNKKRPLTDAITLAVRSISSGNFAFGFKIAQEIVRQISQTLGPRCVTRHAIN